jgi:hypothetical protein
MKKMIAMTLGCVALIATAPASAKPGHGNGHGRGAEMHEMGRLNSQGRLHASDRALERANEHSVLNELGIATDTRLSQRRLNSQGRYHASARARARANRHSAIVDATTETRRTPTRTRTRARPNR